MGTVSCNGDDWGKGPTLHKFCFELTTPGRSYLLDAPTAAELKLWLEALLASRPAWPAQPGPDEAGGNQRV